MTWGGNKSRWDKKGKGEGFPWHWLADKPPPPPVRETNTPSKKNLGKRGRGKDSEEGREGGGRGALCN